MTSRFLLSKSIDGFVLSCQVRRLSEHTISDYSVTLRKLARFLGDISISDISRNDLRKFLADQSVSKKTLYNYHIGLNVFLKWCLSEDLIRENPLDGVPRPKPEQRTIEPIPEDHIRKIMKACERLTYTRNGKTVTQYLPDRFRNRAIILLLLDRGLRASELRTIKNDHLDLEQRSVKVVGKLSKERILYFSPTTAQAIWKYKGENGKYLFPGNGNTPMSRHSFHRMLYHACERVDVPNYSLHDFWHTFAV